MATVRKHFVPKIESQHGEWTVLEVLDKANGPTKISCRCSCGRLGTPTLDSLLRGTSVRCKSCGSKTPAVIAARKRSVAAGSVVAARIARTKYKCVPRKYRAKLSRCVRDAIRRCYNPEDRAYPRYGGRGISVFPAWRIDLVRFVRYLMTLPRWDNLDLQIDRIDNDGNYEPGNLRWVTPIENCQNRRRNSV